MLRTITRLRERAQAGHAIQRPTALTLVMYILTALVSGGRAWIVIPVLAVTVFLYNNHVQNDMLLAFLLVGMVIIALVRGCRNWQNDLNEYQRHLTLERHREQGRTSGAIPDYFTSRRY